MDPKVKEAFLKVKDDMFILNNEIHELRAQVSAITNDLKFLSKLFADFLDKQLSEKTSISNNSSFYSTNSLGVLHDYDNNSSLSSDYNTPTDRQTNSQTVNVPNNTDNNVISADMDSQTDTQNPYNRSIPTHFPTDNTEIQTIPTVFPTDDKTPTHQEALEGLKPSNMHISTGNRGVPTDRQTNQQTDRQTADTSIFNPSSTFKQPLNSLNSPNPHHEFQLKIGQDDFGKAAQIIQSLDSIKKDIRRKFKHLTRRELEVFSLLYELEDQGLIVDYKLLSERLMLSESSIRDYIGKITAKGIPIVKEKINNKQVVLSISIDLRRVATLDTILKLINL